MESKIPENFRCGMVSIIGRPNVGKSTLLNAIVGEKIAIVSSVPQTTRNQIRGIYNDDKCQIIFMDTPGIHMGRDRLDKYMNQSSATTIDDADCIVHVVDPSRRIGEEEMAVVEKLKGVKAPIIYALNKIDIKKVDIAAYINMLEEARGQKLDELENIKIIAISAKNEKNIDQLVDLIYDRIPECPPLYPQDIVTDLPKRIAISDMIREKLFQRMKDEVPHSIGVIITEMRPVKGKTFRVTATILVERDTQKEIVIGKKGQVLKEVGSAARADIEDVFETKVFLELNVKVAKNWRNSISHLQDLGYTEIG